MTCEFRRFFHKGVPIIGVYRCVTCAVFTNDPPEKGRFVCGKDGPKSVQTLLKCVNMLAVVRTEKCRTCEGNVKLKVFGCREHGECTTTTKLPGVSTCISCSDFRTAENVVECQR